MGGICCIVALPALIYYCVSACTMYMLSRSYHELETLVNELTSIEWSGVFSIAITVAIAIAVILFARIQILTLQRYTPCKWLVAETLSLVRTPIPMLPTPALKIASIPSPSLSSFPPSPYPYQDPPSPLPPLTPLDSPSSPAPTPTSPFS